ncbi:hypothetical protein [Brevibacterium sp. FME37]|uniref:hypothetical protein n=1 Tax=Brevibacterium sp. FME37 TaxID=2742607 RepID=UPI001866BE10|nr:hypothetical protein [Brevibacterium sp. FME37]
MNVHCLLTVMLSAAVLTGLSGCGEVPDTVTDRETNTEQITCQRDVRFELAGTNIVVDEIETITVIGGEGGDQARVDALITLDA